MAKKAKKTFTKKASPKKSKPAPKPEYDNNMRGVLFANEKEKENQPDFKGSAEIDGVKFWLAGWKRKSKKGQSFLSITFEPQDVEVDDDGDDEVEADDIDFD